MPSRAASKMTTDHEEIRRWAEERNAQPACVRGTGGGDDIGMIRLDFPGYSGETSLEHIEWDEWFDKFDEMNLALVFQDTTAGGEQSNFNKIIGRETMEQRREGSRASRRHPERARRASASHGGPRQRAAKTASRSGAKKSSSKSSAKKASAKKSASKSSAKKSSAKKSSAKKSSAKKTSAKKASAKKAAGGARSSAKKSSRGASSKSASRRSNARTAQKTRRRSR